ncbi:MAG: hypothetical protein RL134_1888 [Actinomycetota bacterium]|jgi:hypothetical protein
MATAEPSSAPSPSSHTPAPAEAARGRGLVITGAILVVLYLIAAIALLVWFLSGLVTSPEAMSMVFPFWLFAFLMATPLWVGGIAMLGSGRARQRGPVRGAVIAWILAIGGMPAIGVLLTTTISLVTSGLDSLGGVAFAALIIGIPVLTVVALAGGAWLTWGRPRAA